MPSLSLPADAVIVPLSDAIAQCDPRETYHPWVWVEGEVSDVNRARSGHTYFVLGDHSAQIPCVLWERVARGIATPLMEGSLVAVNGWVQPRPGQSHMELDVRSVVLRARQGPRELAKAELRAKLDGEGLLHLERKRPLPKQPRCIGIVTSPAGDVLHDIARVLQQHAPKVRTELSPARVTGEGAATEIVAALRTLSDSGRADVVILARGGGSSSDLAPFETEGVARAIAECRVPVISAVGHEPDTTIADLVADVRCATPSEAAAIAVREWASVGPGAGGEMQVSFRAGGMIIHVQVTPVTTP